MKKKRIKSAVPIYLAAALWLLLGILAPSLLLKPWGLLAAIALSAAVYFAASRKFPGREVEIRRRAQSGDRAIDALIDEGRRRLDSLARANDAIPDADISKNLDRMVRAGIEILSILERDLRQAQAVRRFMNYYLPTADKLMRSYRAMQSGESAGENKIQAMQSIANSLNMIAAAFEKQLDNLFCDRKLDIETDIDVLETMMAADGLISRSAADEQKQTAQAGN